MDDLAKFCKELKQNFKPRITDRSQLVSCWSEKDVLNEKIVDAFVIIFRTRGCTWALNSGCSMCGYFNDSTFSKVSDTELLAQFEGAMKKFNNERFVKIFTSGSFLDTSEVSVKVRDQIISKLSGNTEKISVESRPEYVSKNVLSRIKIKDFEIGIGLETADDKIRKKAINKGFTFAQYKKAANEIKKHNFSLKTYVLIKPPFLTEKESIEDAIDTVKQIKNLTKTISFNPTNVQRNTFVEYLWKRNRYRPSWLYSVIQILKESKKIAPDLSIKCDISGGGKPRGPHNCINCDKVYLKQIADFSLNQDIKMFKDLECECKEKWQDQIELEKFGFGSLVNMYG
jgi:hypothetical protein